MNFNMDGEELLRVFESCKLQAYQDVIGTWTVGYGHTGSDVSPGMWITQDMAEEIFQRDLRAFAERVRSIVHSSLNDNQFSAAVCFAYNIKGWAATPLFGFLVRGDVDSAKQHWLLYDKVTSGGQKIEVRGLKNRRQAELNLFCKPVEVS